MDPCGQPRALAAAVFAMWMKTMTSFEQGFRWHIRETGRVLEY